MRRAREESFGQAPRAQLHHRGAAAFPALFFLERVCVPALRSQLTRALAGDGGEAPLVDLARQDLIDAMHMASARGGAAGADAVDVEWCADGGRFGELPALADVLPHGFRAV